jgi:uncharacterized membrane protein YciS (DUF1049 family)
MNTNGHHRTTTPNVAASVSELTSNIIELTELQSQLVVLDVKKSVEKAKLCVILGIVAACLLLASIPVALIAFGYLLHQQLEWSIAASMGVAAFVGFALCGIVGGVAYTLMQNGVVTLERSRDELSRNIAWLKSTLRNQSEHHARERPINY